MALRLMRLRKRALSVVSALTTLCLLLVLIQLIGYLQPLGAYWLSPNSPVVLPQSSWLALLAIPLVLGLTLAIWWLLQSWLMRVRQRCRLELQYSQLSLMVVDDQFWHQLFELQRESPWLKWAVVAPPQTFEQHLEFAAAYHTALMQLAVRSRQLDNGSVSRGNFTWHAGRPWCYACGLLAAGCGLLFLPYIALAVSGMLTKAGRLAALCDFFLGDLELLPAQQRAHDAARAPQSSPVPQAPSAELTDADPRRASSREQVSPLPVDIET